MTLRCIGYRSKAESLGEPVVPIRVRQRIVQIHSTATQKTIVAIATEARKARWDTVSRISKPLVYLIMEIHGGEIPRSPFNVAMQRKAGRKSRRARSSKSSKTAQRSEPQHSHTEDHCCQRHRSAQSSLQPTIGHQGHMLSESHLLP